MNAWAGRWGERARYGMGSMMMGEAGKGTSVHWVIVSAVKGRGTSVRAGVRAKDPRRKWHGRCE